MASNESQCHCFLQSSHFELIQSSPHVNHHLLSSGKLIANFLSGGWAAPICTANLLTLSWVFDNCVCLLSFLLFLLAATTDDDDDDDDDVVGPVGAVVVAFCVVVAAAAVVVDVDVDVEVVGVSGKWSVVSR